MSDFRVHPMLGSPQTAAVMAAIIGMTIVDSGVSELLSQFGQSSIDADAWDTLTEARWGAGMISAMLGWFAWFSAFRATRFPIAVPEAGLLVGFIAISGGPFMVWSFYRSVHTPEFQDAFIIISRLGFLWSALVILSCIGCIRLGARSLPMVWEKLEKWWGK